MPSSDFASVMLEKVRPEVQSLVDMHDGIAAVIKKSAKAIPVSDRLARYPLLIQNGGDYSVANLDGGNLGGGSGMKYTHFTLGVTATKLGFEVPAQAVYATDSKDKAVEEAMRRTIENAIKEAGIYDDIAFHNIGGNNGIIANATTVGTTSNWLAGAENVFTLDSEFNGSMLRVNQPVDVTDNAAALRTTANAEALPRVSWINLPARQVGLKAPSSGWTTIATLANNDKIAIAGSAPATNTFRNGLYLFNNAATTGTLCGVDRAAYPEINSNVVTANSTALSPQMVLLLKHRIQARRGVLPQDLWGVCHHAQIAAIAQQGLALSSWNRSASDKMIDVMPGTGDEITYCGIKFRYDSRASRSRLDLIAPSTWGRVRMKDLDYFEVEGRKIFEKRFATGGVGAAFLFYLINAENIICADPGSQGMITGLAIPSGY